MKFVLWSITLVRIPLIPVFVLLASEAQEVARFGSDPSGYRIGAIVAMLSIGVSDLLDGWIARRYGLESNIGAMADSVADKLAQVGFVLYLGLDVGPVFTAIPFWFLLVIFGRDLTLLVGVLVLRLRYGPLKVVHRTHGRVATMLIVGVIVWSVFGLPAGGLLPLMILASVMSAWSGTIYALDGAAQGEAMKGRGG
jgi:phosphatidylglycerophosphate synthase